MKIEKVSIEELVSPDWNPRVITEKEMEKLKTSLEEFGYVSPIIVNKHNNHVVGGNQRLSAMKELGYTEIDVVYIDEPNLDKEKALNIALNKISGDWDSLKLENIFNELGMNELKLTGFDELEIEVYKEGDMNFDDLLNYEEDYDLPSDYVDVTGDNAGRSYVISIGFDTQEIANRFLDFLGFEKRMTRDTVQLMFTDLGWDIEEEIMKRYGYEI